MEYKSNCPSCNKPQTRWQTFEPFPGYINQCSACGEDYKSSKTSCIIGLLVAVIIVSSYVMADKGIIPWIALYMGSFALLIITIYLCPYFMKLKSTLNTHGGSIKKWITPFFRMQVFTIFVVTILVGTNLFMQELIINNQELHSKANDAINVTDNIEIFKKIAIYENDSILNELAVYKALAQLNKTLSIGVFLLLLLNMLFYFKIKASHNKAINSDRKKRVALS